MKSAYELAMERLARQSPTITLTPKQKAEIAELESRYAAKLAERELIIKGEIAKAVDRGEFEEIEKLEKQLASDRRTLNADLEEKKQQVRDKSAGAK